MKKLFVMTLAAMALIGCQKADTNPFFNYKNWDTPHGTYPFEEIKTEHFMPAFEQAFAEGYAEIDSIVANPEAPTFENTIVALDEAGEMLNCVAGCFYNLTHSETNEQLQALEQELSPKMSEYSTSIILNEGLFARVKAVYEQRDQLTLTADQKELLQDTYDSFANNGANLDAEAKEKYRELTSRLSKLTLTYGQNVLKATNAWTKLITDEALLQG